MFEPFHHASNTGNIPGMGLGISIVNQAVDLFIWRQDYCRKCDRYRNYLYSHSAIFDKFVYIPLLSLSENICHF
ncbi:MAG: hypothetical protein V7K98_04305 [Nostoc sp.]|uniref:hypothetical protein n=1 Tax=Nostoc sp. TaxID=1180 RepID=UPI002FFBB9F7